MSKLHRRALARGCAAWLAATAIVSIPASASAQTLALPEALSRAAANDPAIGAFEARVEAARAGVRQAEIRPNPRIDAELENFAGTGRLGLLDETETTVYYEQTLERGGKREARIGLAETAIDMEEARAAVRALDLLEQVQAAWIEAQAAEERIDLAQARLETAQAIEREVSRRVSSALDPVFSRERARAAVAEAEAILARADSDAAAARALLASYWGGDVAFVLPEIETATPTPLVPAAIPDEQVLAAEREAADARIALERSRAVQDPILRGGVRHFGEDDAVGFILGGTIPLGRNDSNRGNIEQAVAERQAAEAEIEAARIAREREIARLMARQAATLSETRRIEEAVLPIAERAAESVREGFARGGTAFTYLEISQADAAVFEARSRRIDLLRDFHLDGARLDRLSARHLPLITQAEVRP
jgi:cobalt-zinc-cadmium efflux system outer membrane protein